MNYLLVNLAVADIIYSAFRIPKIIVRYTSIHPDGVTGKVLCTLLTDGNLSWVGAASSIFTLGAISLERHYVVMYPHGSKRKVTKNKLKVCLLANTMTVELHKVRIREKWSTSFSFFF